MRSWKLHLLLMCALAAGCQPPAGPPQPTATEGDRKPVSLVQRAQPAPGAPLDAPAARQWIFQVDVYQIAVPLGTFSRNEEFWKRMDEQCVDASTYDVLFRNGIRVGQAPIAELAHFQKFMDEKVAMHRMSIAGADVKNVELEMKKDLPGQTIFAFDLRNVATGRDYDRSTNVINLAFQPAPRKPGCLRLTLCPMVRAHRKHFEFSALHEEREIQYVAPEMFYDLNLRCDIPRGRFFIVMPSPDALPSTSVGHAFLTRDGFTTAQEQVLLVIPHPAIVEDGK
jgi:hypothetical protein